MALVGHGELLHPGADCGLVVLWIHACAATPGQVKRREGATRCRRLGGRGGLVLPTVRSSPFLVVGITGFGQRMLPFAAAEGEALRINVTLPHQWWWEVQLPGYRHACCSDVAVHIRPAFPCDLYLTSSM